MRTSIATVLALSLLSVAAPAARGQIGPDPAEVYFDSILVSGTGSPPGTVALDISSDGKAFTVLYDAFSVTTVKERSRASKKSTMLVTMHFPEGWSYTLDYVDTRGYGNISAGATGTMTTKTSMKKSHGGWGGAYPISTTTLTGPWEGDYFKRSINPLVQWSPCGAMTSTFRIVSTLKVRGAPSHMTIDSIDGNLNQTYGLAWRQCPSSLSLMQSPVSAPEPSSLAMLAGIALTALLYWWRKHA